MQYEQKFWVVTVSADHAENAKLWGIVQACHGKSEPLKRMRLGDGVVLYSPKTKFQGGAPLMAFTAIGRVAGDRPYMFDMGSGFLPWRLQVQWQPVSGPLAIRPLLDQLELTRHQANWGMAFRYGLTKMARSDFALIARAMVPAGLAIPFCPANPHMNASP